MSETSLYRRHRPQAFDEVVGQEHVVRTLRNAVERDRVHHAYLFVGSRGTGKTSVAKILARSLNCVNGPTVTPCGECESCRTIAAGSSLDVIEMDAASNRSVDDIRELRERVGYAPAAGRWKVYILDEAHMLTREAWNAFLKTLEEPPPNTVFVLCTTEPHKVMPTIVDRCQRFDFQRPSLEQIAEVVRRVAAAESIEIEDGAVAAIARAATGSFRDALGTLDQLVAYGGKRVATDDVLAVLGVAEAELILAAADAIAAEDGKAALEASERLARSGRDLSQFGRDLLAHLRQLLVIRTIGEVPATLQRHRRRPRAPPRPGRGLLGPGAGAGDRRDRRGAGGDQGGRRAADDARAGDPARRAARDRPVARRPGAAAGAGGAAAARARTSEPAAEQPEDNPGPPRWPTDPARPRPPRSDREAVDLERISGLWPAVLDQVRESGSELLSTVFAAARPVAVDVERAVLEVGFPASAAFNKRKAEAQEARERLAEAVRTIVGERLRPVYVLLEGEDEAGPDGAEPSLSEEELIELLRSEFDAEEFEADDAKEAEG